MQGLGWDEAYRAKQVQSEGYGLWVGTSEQVEWWR